MALAFVFPGQGSQSVGMLQELAGAYPLVKDTFDEASQAVGVDLWALVQQGPVEELNRTERTQPAMLAAGVATWRVWQEEGGAEPSFLAGHSLGEYTALTCAGSIAFADAASVVAARGRFMQEAVPEGVGAMAAMLGLSDEQVREICDRVRGDEVLAAVNYNSPGQVVVAGHRQAVERALALAEEAGARKSVLLPVSVPSHCSLMEPAAERLAERLAEIAVSAPLIPVIHNADAAPHAEAEQIRAVLRGQLYMPVLWVDSVRFMADEGVTTIVECGPGKVLTGLCKRISREVTSLPLFDGASLEKVLARVEEE